MNSGSVEPTQAADRRLNRRAFFARSATALASATLAPAVFGVERDWSGKEPVRYPDPDMLVLDQRFAKYKIGNTYIQRLHHDPHMLWAEGCAWNAVGRYLVWSDIPNDRQLRWLEDNGHVSVMRQP